MLLAVDVGNTHTVFGLFDGDVLRRSWRITTAGRTVDELGLLLLDLLGTEALDPAAVSGVAVCTVVPAAWRVVEGACDRYLGRAARLYGRDGDFGMPVRVDNVAQLGPDRVVNALAASARATPPFVVVDIGTAATFDAVDAGGTYVGGAIAPGPGIAADALHMRSARLPRVDVQRPASSIGANTVAAMQSGLFWGYVGLVDGLARRFKAELGGAPWCIATGGWSSTIGPACAEVDEVDEHLTLKGLRAWFQGG